MAFTGVATVTLVADNLVRITGLSLAGAAAGTIALHEAAAAGVNLPAAFLPRPYVNGIKGAVALQDSIEFSANVVTAVTTLVPISVVKTGTTLANFLITLTNTTVATASAGLEIYIRHH